MRQSSSEGSNYNLHHILIVKNKGGFDKRLFDELSPREQEVLHLIFEGYNTKEVGRHLSISPRTVEVYRAHIRQKLHADNLVHLVRIVTERIHATNHQSPAPQRL